MDIWAWVNETQRTLVDEGHERLADLIENLPPAVLADDNAEVEAMVPEALGLARALELPWVEVFVRHWHRQARGGGFAELPDAIDLLEFSHRDENRGCPQSVCTVQDVAIAYSGADGPGFAQDRIDVSRETLGRIDASWPCFVCISSQLADALVDAGRSEEALEFLAGQRAELNRTGSRDADLSEFETAEAEARVELGRASEALEWLDKADRKGRKDDSFARGRRLWRALALLSLGRAEEAREALLPYDLVRQEIAYAVQWVRAVAGLVEAGAYDNDWMLGASVERLLHALGERGRAWDAVQVATWHGELALRRGAAMTARHALSVLRAEAERLRDPARAADRIEALEAALAAHPTSVDLPATPEELVAAIEAEEEPDAEAHAERLDAARRRWPDDLDVVMMLAAALDALGRPGATAGVLREFAEAHPDEPEAQLRYGFALLDAGEVEELEALAARLDDSEPGDAAWLRAQRAFQAGDARSAARLAARVVELHPDALNARRLWAKAADRLEDFAESLRLRTEIIAMAEEDDDVDGDHWDRMMSAAAVGDWATLRESADVLGAELSGAADERPDERWGLIRLRYDARDVVLAGRTGPVTARVIEVSYPGSPQHADDLVVYDPELLEYPTDDIRGLAQVVKVLEEGRKRPFVFDGIDPGEERWNAFASAVSELGILLDVRLSGDYELEVDGEKVPGVYGLLGVPESLSDADAHARLTALTAGWEHPIVWIDLAEAAGDAEAAARQREIAEELGL